LILVALGCSGKRGTSTFPKAPLVLISIDTLRADHLPAYGYRAVETPHLDRLRRDSILFEHAYSHVPLTLPAHVSLLTGLLPFEHGVRDNLGYRLDAKAHPTLTTLLKAQGYATGGAVSAYVLRGGTGIGTSFDFYEDRIVAPEGSQAASQAQRRGGETAALALKWLQRVKDGPFFLFLHVYEPHAPYEPPEPFKSRYPLAYDGEIATADQIVGDFLEELRRIGVYDRALVILLSDHGEGLGEHGEQEHGILLYRWALQVPLLLKLPGAQRAGTSLAAPVQLIDVVPTVTNLLALSAPKGLRGQSLLEPSRKPEHVYGETFYPRIHLGWSDLRSLIDDRYQYIEGRKRELYDVVRDPGELNDIQAGAVARAMATELAGYPAGLAGPGDVEIADLEKLTALGYLGGAVNATGPLPDPRESIHVLADAKAAFRLAADGRDDQAVTAFREILKRFPVFFDARYELGQTLARMGRFAEAYEAYRAGLRSAPSLAGPVSVALARVCLEMGKLDEAELNAKIASKTQPALAHELLARAALSRDDLAGAEREAQLAVGDPVAERNRTLILAEVHIRRAEFVPALAILDGAARVIRETGASPLRDLQFLRGDALARLGRHQEAEAAFRQEIRDFPRNSQAYARLAIVYGLEHRGVRDVDQLLWAMVRANPGPEIALLAAKTLESMGDARGGQAWRRRARPPNETGTRRR
jgi:tetratricopeptide (TPR) repeat protein